MKKTLEEFVENKFQEKIADSFEEKEAEKTEDFKMLKENGQSTNLDKFVSNYLELEH